MNKKYETFSVVFIMKFPNIVCMILLNQNYKPDKILLDFGIKMLYSAY